MPLPTWWPLLALSLTGAAGLVLVGLYNTRRLRS